MEDEEIDEADPDAGEEYGKDGEEGKDEDQAPEDEEKEKSVGPKTKGKAVRCSADIQSRSEETADISGER
jgi:hypothetical protein